MTERIYRYGNSMGKTFGTPDWPCQSPEMERLESYNPAGSVRITPDMIAREALTQLLGETGTLSAMYAKVCEMEHAAMLKKAARR